MPAVNVLVLIHGMTLSREAHTHDAAYDLLWSGLKQREPRLEQEINKVIRVEWGHELMGMHPNGLRDDEKTTRAENFIHDASTYGAVSTDKSSDNTLRPTSIFNVPTQLARRVTVPIKETVLILGFTDAVYYCSPDGERAIRRAVYGQVLEQLDEYETAESVKLHVIAGSLGATVAFDFLYGLFAPRADVPDFIAERQGDTAAVKRFQFWRGRAEASPRTLTLGSKTTTGAQLPLMMMRKQKVVDMLAERRRLDPTVIDVQTRGTPKWNIFYDVDDILGYPTRRLFDSEGTIKEYEVNNGLTPTDAHTQYWTNSDVLVETAKLILQNL